MANLSIAYGQSKSEEELKTIARHSFENLMITLLEFFRLKRSKGKISEIVSFFDTEEMEAQLKAKKGVIFLTAHQANWEISFIGFTDRYPGVAIGRPIKNRWLYKWVLSVREMHEGKIVMPKNAIREGIKALAKGAFLGIVGDQAYPDSGYSYPLFGTRAWTASTPALIAFKTGCPLVFASAKRSEGHYFIRFHSPIWPNLNAPIKEEVPRMMDQAMSELEKSIAETPEQWMWVHDRWKQQGIDHVKRHYRYGFILIALPSDLTPFAEIFPLLRAIYPRSFLTFLAPKGSSIPLNECTVIEYGEADELLLREWKYQLVLDFIHSPTLRKHYLRLGAFKALTLDPDYQMIKRKLVKAECLTTVSF